MSRGRPGGVVPAGPTAPGVGPCGNWEYRGSTERRVEMLIWLLVLLLVILATGGGVALSKFLFLILVVALIVALVGVFNRSTV